MLITLFDDGAPYWCVTWLETAVAVGRLLEMSVGEETNFRTVFVVGHIWTWRPGRTYSSAESVQGRGITIATCWKNAGRVMKQAGNNRCCVRRRCEYWLIASDCPETASWSLTDLMQCKRFHKQRGLSVVCLLTQLVNLHCMNQLRIAKREAF